jgi:hypothetical protein
MFKKIIPNKKVMAVYLGTVLGLMIAAHFFIPGINKVKTAEISYNAIKSQVQAETVRASVLTSAKHELLNLQKQWEMVKQPYIFDPEGGNFYNQLGILADKYKIKDISIIPHPIQERFFMGHLRVLPYDLTIKGSFPNVFNLLSGLEKLDTPAEIKPISIQQQDDGTVLVKTTVFLYSLNPPEQKEYVNGQSGRYDPFFNPDIQKILQQQQNSTNTQNNQSQNNSLNNISQSNDNTSNNSRQNGSNEQSSSQQSNAAPVTSTQQTGNSQTIPPYNSTTTK